MYVNPDRSFVTHSRRYERLRQREGGEDRGGTGNTADSRINRATRRSRASGGAGSPPGALEPLPWVLQLVGARQRVRRRPHAVQALDAGLGGHRIRPPLSLLVLAQLHVEAEQPLDDP